MAVARRCSFRASRWSQAAAAVTTRARRHRRDDRGRRRGGRRAGDHRQLGHRAAVAGSRPGERHHVRQHPAQHHGSARRARRGPEPGPGRGRELRDERGRQDRHVRAPRRPQVDERRPGHRGDFEYAWKRTVSPELAADYAYQFYGIVGAQDYNGCDPKKDDCAALADKMGVKAVDDKTLEVTLTTPQPWFMQQVAHHSFLAVQQGGRRRSSATSGPRRRTSSPTARSSSRAGSTTPRSTSSRTTTGATPTASSSPASTAGMINDGDHRRAGLRGRRGRRPLPGAAAVRDLAAEGDAGVRAVPGARHLLLRRSTSRTSPTSSSAARCRWRSRASRSSTTSPRAASCPSTGLHARGHARVRRDQPGVAVAAGRGRRRAGEAADERGREPEDEDHALHRTTRRANPRHRRRGPGRAGRRSGSTSTIKQQEFQQYLEFLGPPPNKDVDVYRLGWIGDFVDAINFLELWTCESGNNSTNYCNKEYDALIEKARATPDNDARYEIYGQAEEHPLRRGRRHAGLADLLLHVHRTSSGRTSRRRSSVNLLNQADLTKVVVTE